MALNQSVSFPGNEELFLEKTCQEASYALLGIEEDKADLVLVCPVMLFAVAPKTVFSKR